MAITLDGTTGITSPGGDVSVSQSLSGNLTFTGTGNRITGDFSNATVANQVMIQTSTTNGITNVQIIPNGTQTISAFTTHNNSNPFNSHPAQLISLSTDMRLTAAAINNGTGTYLPMTFYTGGSERMRIDTSGNLQFNSGYGSVATAYGCRAWVNFDGTTNVGGNCTIRASGNVSTVADNGTGSYTVNFTNAMPDTNYGIAGSSSTNGVTNGFLLAPGTTGRATTSVAVLSLGLNGNLYDPQAMTVTIFR